MVENFTFCRLLCQFFGCFFIFDLNGRRLHDARATLKTAYTAYALALFCVCLYFEGGLLIGRLARLDFSRQFADAVSTLLNVALMVKVVVNFGCMAFHSGRLLDFFHKCKEYEKRSAFKRPSGREALKRDWIVSIIRLCILTVAVSMAGILVISMATNSSKRAPRQVARFFCVAVYFFYDSLVYLLLRSVGEVLVWYVRAQRVTFEKCCAAVSRGTPVAALRRGRWASLTVESVRQRVCEVRELKCFINGIWSTAIILSSGTLVWMVCITLYTALKAGVFRADVCLSLCYAAYIFLSFLELACISQTLRDEVEFLHYTIDPDGMSISGSGFFRLDKQLVVSIVGSLITLTVILVQTSDELSQRMRERAASTSS
ncbi:hypothetical protein HPB52_016616 [Rhipicephalus sanguineus]|uniref:Gustatory receptor n=1 Tax=Rhipicephalus sanguineus TaxID=34632 RepID=A0A9D4SUR0_RHISA|nr:hypothetical protein HPB52_016616 [Rhipicephalus sanguineus]